MRSNDLRHIIRESQEELDKIVAAEIQKSGDALVGRFFRHENPCKSGPGTDSVWIKVLRCEGEFVEVVTFQRYRNGIRSEKTMLNHELMESRWKECRKKDFSEAYREVVKESDRLVKE